MARTVVVNGAFTSDGAQVSGARFTGYSGVQTSPFFMTPTSVMNPRKVDLGVSLRF